MNKELEKKFDEECGLDTPAFHRQERIKSFINKHFIARSDVQKDLEKMNLYPKADLLDMVGEDRFLDPMQNGFESSGYNQAKAEIRERINATNGKARRSNTK